MYEDAVALALTFDGELAASIARQPQGTGAVQLSCQVHDAGAASCFCIAALQSGHVWPNATHPSALLADDEVLTRKLWLAIAKHLIEESGSEGGPPKVQWLGPGCARQRASTSAHHLPWLYAVLSASQVALQMGAS